MLCSDSAKSEPDPVIACLSCTRWKLLGWEAQSQLFATAMREARHHHALQNSLQGMSISLISLPAALGRSPPAGEQSPQTSCALPREVTLFPVQEVHLWHLAARCEIAVSCEPCAVCS